LSGIIINLILAQTFLSLFWVMEENSVFDVTPTCKKSTLQAAQTIDPFAAPERTIAFG